MSTNHTPTPWKAVDIHSTDRGKRGVVYYQIKQAGSAKSALGFAGVYEDSKTPKADADFIIEAVNSHDVLTARVKELEAALQAFVDYHATDYDDIPEMEVATALLKAS